MANPKILVIPGSTRPGSPNVKLAALAMKELTLIDADVTHISLEDYPLPLLETDAGPKSDPPGNAVKLKQMMAAHHGVFITSPEDNASVTPLLANILAWVSRVRERGDASHVAFRGRVFAIASASPDATGGLRSLITLRQILEQGCGALVIPEQVAVQNADRSFDTSDNLNDTGVANALRAQLARLVDVARMMM